MGKRRRDQKQAARQSLNRKRSTRGQPGTIPPVAVLPLRLFLGITFIYAGIQKLSDPGFFHLGSTTYIGTQILGFSRDSPIKFILQRVLEHAVLAGIAVIVIEILIGIAATAGLFTRLAAIGGLLINLSFFLSASWNTYPYFLGSDIVFVVAWLSLALTGPGPFALDNLVSSTVIQLFPGRLSESLSRLVLGPVAVPAPALAVTPAAGGTTIEDRTSLHHGISRAEVLVGAAVAAVVFVLGLLPRPGLTSASVTGTGSDKGGNGSGGKTHKSNTPPHGGTKVGNTAEISPNNALTVTDPKTGQPDVIVHTTGTEFVAFSAICTHAGCEVEYDPSVKLLVCPCHGSAFNPMAGAAVVAGPAPLPLPAVNMTITHAGDIYIE